MEESNPIQPDETQAQQAGGIPTEDPNAEAAQEPQQGDQTTPPDLPKKEEAGAEPEMPRYRSHKVVQALKCAVSRVPNPDPGTRIVLVPVDTRFEPIKPSQDWVARHRPSGAGYYVVYPDGYESWSPVDSFEEGYTLLELQEEDPTA